MVHPKPCRVSEAALHRKERQRFRAARPPKGPATLEHRVQGFMVHGLGFRAYNRGLRGFSRF